MIDSIVRKHLLPLNEFVFGYANVKGLLDLKFDGFDFAISIGKKLNDDIVDNLFDGPTLEYLHHYQEVNKELLEVSNNIKDDLTKAGIDSILIVPTISLSSKDYEIYLEKLTYEVSHKMIATRAGLGWIGKTDLLISSRFGPRLRLVSILINKDPEKNSTPIDTSKCGKCNICVEKCPAMAANGTLWNINVNRDEFFNAFKCREKCGELAKAKLNVDERICGLCVSVCPIGKKLNKWI